MGRDRFVRFSDPKIDMPASIPLDEDCDETHEKVVMRAVVAARPHLPRA
jgi:hypothetical protein